MNFLKVELQQKLIQVERISPIAQSALRRDCRKGGETFLLISGLMKRFLVLIIIVTFLIIISVHQKV